METRELVCVDCKIEKFPRFNRAGNEGIDFKVSFIGFIGFNRF